MTRIVGNMPIPATRGDLNGKADKDHGHEIRQVDGLDNALNGLQEEVARLAAFHEGGSRAENLTISGTFPTNPGWATMTGILADGWSWASSTQSSLAVPAGSITAEAIIPTGAKASLRWTASGGSAQLLPIEGPTATHVLSSPRGGTLQVTGEGGSGYGGKPFEVVFSWSVDDGQEPDAEDGFSRWSRTAPIQFWGDSAVAGGDNGITWAAGEDLPAQLSAHLTVPVNNLGRGGWASSDILFHSGITEVYATPAGGAIPASGPVDLNLHGMELQSQPTRAHIVDIAGVRGSFSQTAQDEWRFTRYNAGDAIPIDGPVRVMPIQHFDTRSTQIFLMGGNDRGDAYGTGPDRDKEGMSLANYLRAVEAIPADPVRHVLVGGIKTRATTWPGDQQHIYVQAVNDTLRRACGHVFVDRNAWLAENGLRILGLEPTADDRIKMAAGVIPSRVMADDTHVRKEVVAVEAAELWAPAIQLRGWA